MPNDANHIEDLVASYIDRLNRGERLTADQVREDHPELAEEILDHSETFVDFDSQANGGTRIEMRAITKISERASPSFLSPSETF